ncbi:MAG: glycosyltransferase family 4 protein [Opitutaceae bacterium]
METSASIWLSHPTGNANVRAALEALDSADMLECFHTCLGISQDNQNGITSRLLAQRRFPIAAEKIATRPGREAMRLLLQKSGLFNSLYAHEVGRFSVDRIYQDLDQTVVKRLQAAVDLPTAIYTYEDAAASTFAAASERSITRIYDLPIGYWRAARRIQIEESELHPDWALTMPALIDSDSKLARKDEELKLANHIIVASQFTAQTLEDAPFPLAPISVIPYGCPPVTAASKHSDSKQPLKVLYVGSLSQRKGLSYLLQAVEMLGDSVELTLIGKRVADCAPLDAALQKYNWIESLPHQQILEAMQSHDVFVFPSLFEGFGLVITEALSQGMPIIATSHTCAPDIIEDGKEGFIVPIRDAVAIASKLECLAKDRDLLAGMQASALETASRTTWQNYSSKLVDTVKTVLKAES